MNVYIHHYVNVYMCKFKNKYVRIDLYAYACLIIGIMLKLIMTLLCLHSKYCCINIIVNMVFVFILI